jgi:N-acetylglucosaminyl-diphospho-decaprenol L-rhamnosyltransferase
MSVVNVVVVTYNSRETVRDCVKGLAGAEGLRVTVVDNASADGTLDAVNDLDVNTIQLEDNGGFAHGCNRGWRSDDAPYALFLNPDATIDPAAVRRLALVLDENPRVGLVAPRIEAPDGSLDFSQRRFPRFASTYAQALFLHRLFPRAAWTDEVIRDGQTYGRESTPEWVSGACMLTRRDLLETLNGLDEGFFMYCEDKDLCRRIWDAGLEIRYLPEAVCIHEGGASAPRSALVPVLAESRVRYARKHRRPLGALGEQIGIALGAATHALLSAKGREMRAGYARSLRSVVSSSDRSLPPGRVAGDP